MHTQPVEDRQKRTLSVGRSASPSGASSRDSICAPQGSSAASGAPRQWSSHSACADVLAPMAASARGTSSCACPPDNTQGFESRQAATHCQMLMHSDINVHAAAFSMNKQRFNRKQRQPVHTQASTRKEFNSHQEVPASHPSAQHSSPGATCEHAERRMRCMMMKSKHLHFRRNAAPAAGCEQVLLPGHRCPSQEAWPLQPAPGMTNCLPLPPANNGEPGRIVSNLASSAAAYL